MTTLEYLKVKTGESDEQILGACILDAKDEVKSYINQQNIPKELEGLVRKLALFYFNRLGVEGSIAHNEGGIANTFITELSDSDRSRLNQHRIIDIGGYSHSEYVEDDEDDYDEEP